MIARSASGSFRDALGTLDQLVAFGGNRSALDDGAGDARRRRCRAALRRGRRGRRRRPEGGPARGRADGPLRPRPLPVRPRPARPPAPPAGDPDRRRGARPPSSSPPPTRSGCRPRRARSAPATLVRTIDELAEALTAVREGDDARMAVEIALLKAARPDLDPSTEGLLRRIERLESKGRGRPGRGSCRAQGPTIPCGTLKLPRGGPPYAATRGRNRPLRARPDPRSANKTRPPVEAGSYAAGCRVRPSRGWRGRGAENGGAAPARKPPPRSRRAPRTRAAPIPGPGVRQGLLAGGHRQAWRDESRPRRDLPGSTAGWRWMPRSGW